MNIFDEFLVGNFEEIKWCFELSHFNQRLNENNISLKYIKQMILEEDFIRYEQEADKSYGVYYPAPPTKDYKEIKLVFGCDEDTINLITVMPITSKYTSDEYKNQKKMRDRAHSRVNRNFKR